MEFGVNLCGGKFKIQVLTGDCVVVGNLRILLVAASILNGEF